MAPQGAGRGFALLWAAAVLVPLIGVMGAGIMSWQDVRTEAEARIDRTAEMLRQHALRALGTQEAILSAAARATAGQEWDALRGSRAAHLMLSDLSAAGAPVVSGVLVTDDQDRPAVASFEFPARPVDLGDRDYVRALRAGSAARAVGEVVESRPMGWRIFPVARTSLPAPSGGAPGIVVSSFTPTPFEEFYAAVAETPNDVVALLRTDGAVLARHPPVPSGQEDRARAAFAQLLTGPRDAGAPVVELRSPFDGRPRLYAVREAGEWPVVVLYGLSSDALHATWRHRMVAPFAGGLGAAALLLGITALAVRGAKLQHAEALSRAEAEAQLARAGRAAAIGLLAAGLAHDVKNLVQAVRSGARLMERRAEDPAEIRRCAALLGDAAERGRRLVDAMVAFARGQAEQEEAEATLEVGTALRELAELLGRTLGSGWRVQAVVPPGLPPARGDRAGFAAAVINLAANARDAMPRGGTVTISAWVEQLAEPLEEAGLKPGRYVVAAVADSGEGMDAVTLARIAEPFFSTKPPGIGTGLGLATVRGFCARAGGALRFDSLPGRGTTAAMWLPQA
ncbi:ATP-binding protein [Falsiroseomonas sp. CW058]|uniref:ATP-binding protein n=1 Tax=Falsiroseomonas sp. CW058 TaxID=3388664 RepID=UPI003D319F06